MLRAISALLLALTLHTTSVHAADDQVWDPSTPHEFPAELGTPYDHMVGAPPTSAHPPVQHNFTDYLQALPPSNWVLIEFYAHWCPHWYAGGAVSPACTHNPTTANTFAPRMIASPPFSRAPLCSHRSKSAGWTVPMRASSATPFLWAATRQCGSPMQARCSP